MSSKKKKLFYPKIKKKKFSGFLSIFTNNYRAPLQKLNALLKTCKSLFRMKKKKIFPSKIFPEILETLKPGNQPTVDDFFPLLVFLVLRTNPPALYSTLNYITNFRRPEG